MPTNNNILYIGPYRQNDGWGLASRDYLLSMSTCAKNVSAHPIYLYHSIEQNIPNIIKTMETNRFAEYDTIIQHCLPFAMTKIGSQKNIGMLFLENQKFNSHSINNLNAMDEIWVSSNLEKENLEKAGIIKPVFKVGHAIDVNGTQKIEQSIKFNKNIEHHYKFYVIGEYIQRKNIKDVVAAFHLEFDTTDPVSLIIKTSLSGVDSKVLANEIKKQCHDIKQSLRIRKQFHPEIIITERLNVGQLNALHQLCDCFVMASYGEAFCRPAAEALCNGKYCILSANMGVNEAIDRADYSEIECFAQPVILENASYIGAMDIYNGHEDWYQPSINSLRQHMRQAFINRPTVDKTKYMERFSYNTIGQNICQRLS